MKCQVTEPQSAVETVTPANAEDGAMYEVVQWGCHTQYVGLIVLICYKSVISLSSGSSWNNRHELFESNLKLRRLRKGATVTLTQD